LFWNRSFVCAVVFVLKYSIRDSCETDSLIFAGITYGNRWWKKFKKL